MSKIKVQGNASGTGVFTVTSPATNTDRTITLPDGTGTLLNSDGDGSSLTGVGVDGIVSSANATAITITATEQVGIGTTSPTAGKLSISTNVDPGTTPAALDIVVSGVGGGTATNQYGIKVTSNGYNSATNMYGIYSYTPTQYTAMPYGGYFEGGTGPQGYGVYAKSQNTNLASGGSAYAVYGTMSASESASATGKSYAGYFTNTGTSGTETAIVGVHINSTNGSPLVVNTGSTERFRVTNDGRGLSQFTAKAWCNLDQRNTQSIRDSHNISSVTDQGTGNSKIFYTNNTANTDNACVATGKSGGFATLSGESSSYVQIGIRNHLDNAEDTPTLTFVVFGD